MTRKQRTQILKNSYNEDMLGKDTSIKQTHPKGIYLKSIQIASILAKDKREPFERNTLANEQQVPETSKEDRTCKCKHPKDLSLKSKAPERRLVPVKDSKDLFAKGSLVQDPTTEKDTISKQREINFDSKAVQDSSFIFKLKQDVLDEIAFVIDQKLREMTNKGTRYEQKHPKNISLLSNTMEDSDNPSKENKDVLDNEDHSDNSITEDTQSSVLNLQTSYITDKDTTEKGQYKVKDMFPKDILEIDNVSKNSPNDLVFIFKDDGSEEQVKNAWEKVKDTLAKDAHAESTTLKIILVEDALLIDEEMVLKEVKTTRGSRKDMTDKVLPSMGKSVKDYVMNDVFEV